MTSVGIMASGVNAIPPRTYGLDAYGAGNYGNTTALAGDQLTTTPGRIETAIHTVATTPTD